MEILIQESLSRACIRHLTPPLVTKAVEGNDIRPSTGVEQQELAKHYFKILYVGHFSGVAQQREPKLINHSANSSRSSLFALLLKLRTFSTWKILFLTGFRVRIMYQFSCASYNACYVGETSRYFAKCVREHMSSDRSSHVYEHLQALEPECRTSCNLDCFKILDSAPS